MELNGATLGLIVTFLSLIVAYLSYNLGKRKEDKQEVKEDTTTQTSLKMQLEYISKGIDDIKSDMKDMKIDAKATDKALGELSIRVTRVEESEKSAHKRLNELEQRVNEMAERK
ncbi:hypothetical protein CLSAB_19510 [Clostridium saccharobutylicum]|uniref:hypothetical protein n=1 Tax=Clostridium saccharobutylicum TaxID=169679 RepID=UPI00098CDDA6|nr:hypothetical protein [Clostridium saccharobutylicum]OOM17231.1 hypothetical protein CLSAB_19510 [Clostridium saccharobutylicum]